MSWPADPVAAVTHPDPYPYYAALARRPLERHQALGLWVAAGARDVEAVLASELCRVRPASEPVPRAIDGTAAGSVFGRLVRMNDGVPHAAARRVVAAALAAPDASAVAATSRARSRAAVEALDLGREPARIMELALDVPARVMGGLLGLAGEPLDRVVDWAGDFVRGIAAGASADRRERATPAATQLEGALSALDRSGAEGLVLDLAREAERAGGPSPAVVVANAIGFLSQPYEATAGLIGNAAVALSRDRDLADRVRADPRLVPDLLQEVLRHDPPVHNTRRFVARDGSVAGASVREGEAVLVVLAAANRDPGLNTDPDLFRLDRPDRRSVSFGSGPHACPGDRLASAIAYGVVEALVEVGFPFERLGAPGYLPLVNVRIPTFADGPQRDQ
jgi:cytochrome P450